MNTAKLPNPDYFDVVDAASQELGFDLAEGAENPVLDSFITGLFAAMESRKMILDEQQEDKEI